MSEYDLSKEEQIQIYEERAEGIEEKNEEKDFLKKYITKVISLEESRKELLSNAKGRVLEVAVGRGGNFQFYPSDVEIDAVDFSPTLLKVAKETAIENNIQADFVESDVETLEFEVDSFDTIVSTLTLCAYDNPIEVLDNFNKWCKPAGQILLLEHGISSNKLFGWLLNGLLNILDSWHLKNMGCHLNSDILNIIDKSDIKVEKLETCLVDTHYLILGKPDKKS